MSYEDEYDDNSSLFSDVASIDIKRKKKICTKLQDEHGDEVDMKEIVDSINRYITDQMMADGLNKLRDKVFPLLSNVCLNGLTYNMESRAGAAFVASQEVLRYGVIRQMMLSFYFLKFVNKNNLTVITTEEDISDEEIDRLKRLNKATSLATMGAIAGLSPQEILRDMVKTGKLTQEDLKSFHVDEESDDVSESSKEKQADTTGKSGPKSN